MSLDLEELQAGKVLLVRMSGKLKAADYEVFTPAVERLIEKHGKLNIVVDMLDFQGWEMKALWEDIKFDAHHFRDFERIAMIGDQKWESAMATFCKPFTSAEVRYFDQGESQEAIAWASDTATEKSSAGAT